MKILHASDLHFDKAKFDRILSLEFDICCISGDLIDTNQKDIIGQKAWVKRWLENFKKPIFVCSGNHDVSESGDVSWIRASNIYADGDIKTLEGIKFGCAPLSLRGYFGFCRVRRVAYAYSAHTYANIHRARQRFWR